MAERERKGRKMEIKKCVKESFSVIGREGSTKDGAGFIQKLWEDANSHFNEVAHLAKRDENGNIGGIWGAMSDFSRSFKPWENNFTEGLYLAGVEAADEAKAPEGWVKWTIPGYEYLYVKCTEEDIFRKVLAYMEEQGMKLAGAVHDFNCPEENGQGYMFFPVRRLQMTDSDMELRMADDPAVVSEIAERTIKTIYPHYYPSGAVQFFLDLHSKVRIEEAMSSEEIYLVMVQGKLIGTGSIRKNEICRLFILPECQGKGYGSRLMDLLEARIFERYPKVHVDASFPAESMYLKRGYEIASYEKIETENRDFLCYHIMEKREEQAEDHLMALELRE